MTQTQLDINEVRERLYQRWREYPSSRRHPSMPVTSKLTATSGYGSIPRPPKETRGALEVVATCDTQQGESGFHIPKGTIGYVINASPGYRQVRVWWAVPRSNNGLGNISVHPQDHVEPTGRRMPK